MIFNHYNCERQSSRRTWADHFMWEHQNYNSLLNNNRLENVVAAKSLHLYPNLCDPMDCSLSGSSVHGIFQARECWIPPKKGCPTLKGKGEAPIRPSVQFSSVQTLNVSDSSQPHELQHARLPYPSPTPGVHSDSRPLSQWCHPAISSSLVPFSTWPQSLPASESFPMSQLFAWGGQITGVSASASFLPKKSQGWSPSEWTGWISLQSKGFSSVFPNTTVQKCQFLALSFLHSPTLTSLHDHWAFPNTYGCIICKKR